MTPKLMVSWRLISRSDLCFMSVKQIFDFTETKIVPNTEDDDPDDVQGFLFRNLK